MRFSQGLSAHFAFLSFGFMNFRMTHFFEIRRKLPEKTYCNNRQPRNITSLAFSVTFRGNIGWDKDRAKKNWLFKSRIFYVLWTFIVCVCVCFCMGVQKNDTRISFGFYSRYKKIWKEFKYSNNNNNDMINITF